MDSWVCPQQTDFSTIREPWLSSTAPIFQWDFRRLFILALIRHFLISRRCCHPLKSEKGWPSEMRFWLAGPHDIPDHCRLYALIVSPPIYLLMIIKSGVKCFWGRGSLTCMGIMLETLPCPPTNSAIQIRLALTSISAPNHIKTYKYKCLPDILSAHQPWLWV
jgi:hypothetical protein